MNLLDKIITHNRDKVGDFGSRVVLHIPIGFISIASVFVHWVLPLVITIGFIYYERNEDLHTQDQAWKDMYGWLFGAILASFTLFGLKLWFIGG